MMQRTKTYGFITLALLLLFSGSAAAEETSLIWSTFLGGSGNEESWGSIAVDDSGNAYVAGNSISADFPTTTGAFDTTYNSYLDVFIVKLNPTGSSLVYSTFLGGKQFEWADEIALDDSGSAYLTGQTTSSDFPITADAFDTSYNNADAYVTKLNPAGSALIYSTFLGGSQGIEAGFGLAIDGSGNAYITGPTGSSDFPTTAGAFDSTHNGGQYDIFVTKLNAAGSDLDYSTFIGGSYADFADGIATDDAGNAYIIGSTESTNFPTTTGAFDITHNGGVFDVFVTKLNSTGGSLIYSSYIGGDDDSYLEERGYGIALDGSANAYITGQTGASDFPATSGAFDTTYNGGTDVFVARLNATGSALDYATFLGGSDTDESHGIAVDDSSNAYVTGSTRSSDFPFTVGAYDTSYNGNTDAYVTQLNSTGSALTYSTFLGGSGSDKEFEASIALDNSGNAYVTGGTESSDFPTTDGAFDIIHNGGVDVFVSKLDLVNRIPPEAIDDLTVQLEDGAKSSSGNMRLSWSDPWDSVAVDHYVIYRGTSAGSLGDSLASTIDTTYLDIGAAGDVLSNYYYVVKVVDTVGNKSGESNQVGEFDMALINGMKLGANQARQGD